MKVIAFIPARYQSTRFPGKPLALIMEKPMIQHVYERAASCPDLTDVCVATDDERILNCVVQFGGKALMTRKGHRSGTDRVCEAALKSGLGQEDVVVNIQGDQPVFDPSVIPQMIAPILEDPSVAMSTLKCRIEREEEIRNPNCVKVVTDKEGFALFFSRLPPGHYNTDLGHSLDTLVQRHSGVVDHRTTVIFVGDARNNYNDPRLDLMEHIQRRSKRIIWLNPEHPRQWGSGDSDMPAYLPYTHAVHRVSTLAELTTAVDRLLTAH